MGKSKISTESYKGVRDFYPEDQQIQNYIFGIMRKVSEEWGYLEYNASILEPLDLYKSKSSEEIVNEQIYFFTDRGGREVALRPEMTPTVARMVAAKLQETPIPIRWYSIANFFRYEKPQRGRFREFYQLNVDIFGVDSPFAEAEVISLAADLMKRFGAKNGDFKIKINSRTLLDDIFKKLSIPEEKKVFVYRLIDKKEKISEGDFRHSLTVLIGEEEAKNLLESLYFGEGLLTMMIQESSAAKYLNAVINILRERGVSNLEFTPTLTRGFDYYTGTVFEIFDTNKENTRALFGGGRYDNLLGNFLKESVPAFGFGMGDATMIDFLLTRGLLPKAESTTNLYIAVPEGTDLSNVYRLTDVLRKRGVNVAVDISGKKLADQLKGLEKRVVPFVMTVGLKELESQKFVVRNTKTREEKSGDIEEIINFIKNI